MLRQSRINNGYRVFESQVDAIVIMRSFSSLSRILTDGANIQHRAGNREKEESSRTSREAAAQSGELSFGIKEKCGAQGG